MFTWLRRLFGRQPAAPLPDTASEARSEPRLRHLPGATPAPIALAPVYWPAAPRLPATVLFVDVETTGLKAGSDRIVSFAGILVTTAELAKGTLDVRYGHYIVDPGRICHPHAAAVHGYSDWLLRHQEPFGDVVESVMALIDDAELIVAHNAEFDIEFINAELRALGRRRITKPVFCTMERYRDEFPGNSARLDDAAARFGFSRAGPRHGALEDAWLAMMIYFHLLNCTYRAPFSAFERPHPQNLRPAPPEPPHVRAAGQAAETLRTMSARTNAAPPQISATFRPSGIDANGGNDESGGAGGRPDDELSGITFAIEYVDASRQRTMRRITIQDIRRSDDGRVYLACHCHECGEQRTFRADRIQSIIDLDGVVYEPERFFREELRLALPSAPQPRPAPATAIVAERPPSRMLGFEPPGAAQRRVARDGARLLAALARSDGVMHPAEIDVIVDYIVRRAACVGIGTDQEDREALAGYVKRQRPTEAVLEECLTRMARGPVDEQRLLLQSAITLAEADGQRDTAEVMMLLELQKRLVEL